MTTANGSTHERAREEIVEAHAFRGHAIEETDMLKSIPKPNFPGASRRKNSWDGKRGG